MSYDTLGVSDAMLDSLSLQLREAEARRAEAERAHQDALAQLRGVTSGYTRVGEPIETLQSKARELEKKAALETVRCEELQLELSAALKSRSGRQQQPPQSSSSSHHHQHQSHTQSHHQHHPQSSSTSSQHQQQQAPSNHLSHLFSSSGSSSQQHQATGLHQPNAPTTVTWAPSSQAGGSEIDRIMAKIEQARLSIANDNRILAELEHPRTTGPTSCSMLPSSMGVGLLAAASSSSAAGPASHYSTVLGASCLTGRDLASLTGNSSAGGGVNFTGTGIYTGVSSMGVITSSSSSHALMTTGGGCDRGGTSSLLDSYNVANPITSTTQQTSSSYHTGIGGAASTSTAAANISPLPIRAHQITTMPPLCQSSTMPVLSLHNTYALPSGSASYTLGLSGAPVVPSYTYQSTGTVGLGALGDRSGASGLGGGLVGTLPLSTALPSLGAYNTSTSYSTYTNPLLKTGAMNVKLKPLDEIDLGLGRYSGPTGNRSGTPLSPIPSNSWGLDSYTSGLDGVNPAFMHTQRPLSRLGGLDLDTGRPHGLALNGTGEPQVDMLDIPGKGRCCVFIARFSYDPPDESEGELTLQAGDYLLVWGSGEPQGGYFDAELLDGRRGLVPASFVQRLIGDDLLEFHQAVVSTLRDADDVPVPLDPAPMPPITNPLLTHTSEDMARLSETHGDLGPDQMEDEADTVPAPRHLTLERQLNKSVLIGWSSPEPPGYNQIESYHVYVDGVLKVTVKANERTRALVEGVDCNRPHRISVRSVTQNRRTSRDAACTMIIGRDTAHMGPSAVRAGNITCSSAVISWLPANSNHQHVVCVNNVEVRTVKPGVYRHTITGLAPSTQYRVTVRAKHLRAPGQAPAPGPPPEEAPGAYTDFRTLAKGLPDPPQDIQVEAGPQDGTLLVTWQPVARPPQSGPVTGYAVYADGKKVTDVDSPTGDHALIDIGKLVGLNPKAVTVRTKSRDAQSSDSQPTMIPNVVRNAARNRAQNMPHSGLPPHMRGPQQQQQLGQPGQPGNQQQMQQQQQMQMQQQQQGQQMRGPMQNQMNQQIIDHDESLSDKEIYPGSMHQQQMGSQQSGSSGGIPAIEITKDNPNDVNYISDDSEYQESGGGGGSRRRSNHGILANESNDNGSSHQQPHSRQQSPQQPQQPILPPSALQQQQQQQSPSQYQQQSPHQSTAPLPQGYQTNQTPRNHMERGRPPNPTLNQQNQQPFYGQNQAGQQQSQQPGPRGIIQPMNPQQQQQQQQQQMQQNRGGAGGPLQTRGPLSQQQQQQKKARFFVAMFDYDPSTMSPNPDGCEEELPFQEGDTIKVYGDKDPDGFYWGELRGRRGYVPHNMVTEIEEGQVGAQGGSVVPGAGGSAAPQLQQSVRGVSRDRWGDICANMPVKRMIALYDYDPQELSPNVDAEVELSFKTGEVILVYGEMDEDGFYMGELDNVRGLVPSNFLAEASTDQYNNPNSAQGRGAGMNSVPGAGANRGGRMGGIGTAQGAGIAGPGARGPPPPPRDNMNMGPVGLNQRGQPMRKDARPTSPTLLDNTGHPAPDHQTQGMQGKGGMIGRVIGGSNMTMQQQGQQPFNQQQQAMQMGGMGGGGMMTGGMMNPQQQQQQQQQPQNKPFNSILSTTTTTTTNQEQQQQHQAGGGVFSTASNLFSGATNAATGGLFANRQQPQKGVPQIIPQPGIGGMQQPNQQQGQQQPFNQQQQSGPFGGLGGAMGMNQQGQQQPGGPQGPNLMQKLNEITAPGGDILSKGKELIFMKFGLGGK